MDLMRDRVWVDEREVKKLQPLQVRFLGYLVLNAGRVCTHDELRDGVFGAEAIGDRNGARIVSVRRDECDPAVAAFPCAGRVRYKCSRWFPCA